MLRAHIVMFLGWPAMARDGEVIQMQHSCHHGHRRTGQHPFGGANRVCPNGFGGGG